MSRCSQSLLSRSFGIVIWEVLMQKKPYTGKHQPCSHGMFPAALFPGRAPRLCWFSPGANMMAIIVKVAAGKRPGLELVRDDWPGECHQMLDLMKRCWDQDPKQRPSFAGGTGLWISQGSAPRGDKFVSSSPSYICEVCQLGALLVPHVPFIPFPSLPPWLWRPGQPAQLSCCVLADIPVETDVLLALIQSLVQDPENERLVRKMSHKPTISRSQQVRGTPGTPRKSLSVCSLFLPGCFPSQRCTLQGVCTGCASVISLWG